MSKLDELRKLNVGETAMLLGIIFAILIPGGLTVLHHREDLFVTLSIPKICMLAAAFTLPLIFINFMAMDETIKPSKGGSTLIDAMAISCIPLYVSLTIAFLADFSYKGHIAALVILQCIVFYFIRLIAKHEK